MPYIKSRARKSFESRRTELYNLSKTSSYKKSGFSYKYQNTIYQSSIFLLCAAVEEFIKNLCDDLAFSYKKHGARMNQLPLNLRSFRLLSSQKDQFKSYINTGDERKCILKVNKSYRNFEFSRDENSLPNYITGLSIYGTKKYPSIKNIKAIFFRLGLNDVFKTAQIRGRRDYSTPYESFLSIRESISHQSPPNLTIQDVKRHFDNVLALINQLDRILYSQVCSTSAVVFWTVGEE